MLIDGGKSDHDRLRVCDLTGFATRRDRRLPWAASVGCGRVAMRPMRSSCEPLLCVGPVLGGVADNEALFAELGEDPGVEVFGAGDELEVEIFAYSG